MMKTPNPVPSEKDLPFKLADVVLVRYSNYPYWPATVEQTHQKRFKGKWFAVLPTRRGDTVLCYWCTFANEDAGGWVRADRMVLFHPAILNKIRVDKDTYWYGDQKEAIDSVLNSFQTMQKGKKKEVPILPADLEQEKHNGTWDGTDDDDDIISDDGSRPGLIEDGGEDSMDLGDSEHEDQGDLRPSTRAAGRPSKAGKTLIRRKTEKVPRKAPKHNSLPAEEGFAKKRSKTSKKNVQCLLDSVDNDPEEPARKAQCRNLEEKTSKEHAKRLLDSVEDDPEEPTRRRKAHDRNVDEEVIASLSGKRRRHAAVHLSERSKKVRKLEAELASAQKTISSLKKSREEKEAALAELARDGVACMIPPPPPPNQEPLPGRDKYISVPANANKFGEMMHNLTEDYDSFTKAAEAAGEARKELEKTIETVKKLYHDASEEVSVAEEQATKKEGNVIRDLREILEADIQVEALQERRAGRPIRGMLKKCKNLPAIHDLCGAIFVSWKTQVVDYMKENEGKVNQGSGGGAKSSAGEKPERTNSQSTIGDAEDKSEKKGRNESRDEDVERKDVDAKKDDTKGEDRGEPKRRSKRLA